MNLNELAVKLQGETSLTLLSAMRKLGIERKNLQKVRRELVSQGLISIPENLRSPIVVNMEKAPEPKPSTGGEYTDEDARLDGMLDDGVFVPVDNDLHPIARSRMEDQLRYVDESVGLEGLLGISDYFASIRRKEIRAEAVSYSNDLKQFSDI